MCVSLMCLGRLKGVGLWAMLLCLDLSIPLSMSLCLSVSLGMWIDNIVVGGRLSLSLSLSRARALSLSLSLGVVL